MLCDKKKDGIILSIKKVSEKFFLCGVLFSDSLFLKVFVNSSKNNIAVGHQIFGEFYLVDNKQFFKIESTEFFLGSSFWFSHESLSYLIKLIKCVLNTVPENLFIKNLYKNFIEHVKLIHKNPKYGVDSFNNWIQEALI